MDYPSLSLLVRDGKSLVLSFKKILQKLNTTYISLVTSFLECKECGNLIMSIDLR